MYCKLRALATNMQEENNWQVNRVKYEIINVQKYYT